MRPWLIASLLLCSAPAAADAFRCDNLLVTTGDTRGEVIAKCGEPAEISHRTILRRAYVRIHGRYYPSGGDYFEIPVELWIYNLGPNRFMRLVRFEDGVVEEIETLGYGYHESAAGPRGVLLSRDH
jgi:hypothetical protein